MIWGFKNRQEVANSNTKPQNDLSTQSFDLLQAIDAESIVVTASDQVIYYSEKVSNLNLIKDERIQNKELSNLVRAVRRSGAHKMPP